MPTIPLAEPASADLKRSVTMYFHFSKLLATSLRSSSALGIAPLLCFIARMMWILTSSS
jgi:hypothetical protein